MVIVNLTELKRCKRASVTKISKYNHICRMHGIKVGAVVDVIYHFNSKIAVLINHRETVAIPKTIALHIEVVVIR